MELTERERRILSELEGQFAADRPAAKRPAEPPPRRIRPQWTVLPSVVLAVLLLGTGIALGVTSAELLGVVLLVWWLAPLLRMLLRAAGRILVESLQNAPPGPVV
jgi:hypothetical protein